MKKLVKFPEVLFFQEGPGVRNTQYTSEGVKLLNVANLVNGQVDLSTSDRFISIHEAYGKYKNFLCDKGDFIIASSGIKVEYVDKKMGFVDGSMLPLCMNTSTIRFKVLNNKELNIRYFMYYLKSKHFKAQLGKQITGSAQLNYGPSHLKDMTLPMTDIGIQNNIVNILDKIQNIINTYETKLEKLDKLVRARFVEMFGDPVRNSKNWNTEKLCSIAPINKYNGDIDTVNGKVWLLNLDMIESCTGNIVDFLYEFENRITSSTIKFDENCVLYSKLRPYLNKVVIPERKGYATSELVSMSTEKINKYFLANLLRQDSFVNFSNATAYGAKMPRASMDLIKNFDVINPPTELQNQFGKLVIEVEKSKFALKLLHSYIMIMM